MSPVNVFPAGSALLFEGIERDGELLTDGIYTDIEVYSLLKLDVAPQ